MGTSCARQKLIDTNEANFEQSRRIYLAPHAGNPLATHTLTEATLQKIEKKKHKTKLNEKKSKENEKEK